MGSPSGPSSWVPAFVFAGRTGAVTSSSGKGASGGAPGTSGPRTPPGVGRVRTGGAVGTSGTLGADAALFGPWLAGVAGRRLAG
ncbi:MAG: hypothetical protein ABR540_05375, partial [Acidimicrobiales bacterium]